MKYTIISAAYSNQDHTAAVVLTQEAGVVLCSPDNEPELWEAATSGEILNYTQGE